VTPALSNGRAEATNKKGPLRRKKTKMRVAEKSQTASDCTEHGRLKKNMDMLTDHQGKKRPSKKREEESQTRSVVARNANHPGRGGGESSSLFHGKGHKLRIFPWIFGR